MLAMDTQLRRAIKSWTGISRLFSRVDCEGQYQYVQECIPKSRAAEGPRDLDGLVQRLRCWSRTMSDVLERSVEVLGSIKEAVIWLDEPAPSLGGDTPIMVAQTEEGALRVKILLGQLEHGVFV